MVQLGGAAKSRQGAVRVLQVGLGKMGQLHLGCVSKLSCVEVIGVVDLDPGKRKLANGLPFSSSIFDFANECDAAIIAVPPNKHGEIAVPLLLAGVNCLVEKPLALDLGEIEAMKAAARRGGSLLAVGHIERFNPKLEGYFNSPLSKCELTRVDRLSMDSGSLGGHDVISDLMVHDLDWITLREGATHCSVKIAISRWRGPSLAYVECTLDYGSRRYELAAGHGESRRLRRFQISRDKDCYLEIDLLAGATLQSPDALTRQAEAFLNACSGAPSQVATADDAIAVHGLAERIRTKCFNAQEAAGQFT